MACGLFLLALAPCGVCLAVPAAQPGQSTQSLRSLTLQQLGQVEVTTYSKAPSELWDTPASVYVITSDQILRSGATTIADALRLAPGVEVGRYSSDSWAVGIRGLENDFSKSVLVLIDGRSVYNPIFAGIYWDVQDLPLDDIDHIEVIRGPGGTIWGPNAANGVINIITKHAIDTRGVSADALGGNQDLTIDDLQYGGSVSHWNYRAFGRGFKRRHEYHSNGIDEDNWHQERFGFRADGSWGRQTYFVSGNLYRGDAPQIVSTMPWDTEVSGGDINVRWEHDLGREKGFYVQAYAERDIRSRTVANFARNTYDIDFIHHFHLNGRNLFSYGGTLHWSTYRESPELFSVTTGADYEHEGFVQDRLRLAPGLWITGGTKLEYNNYSGFDFQPSARILWSNGEQQALWGGVTRAVTTPSDIEENYDLHASAGNLVLQVLGNPNFKSEDVIGYEAGYRRLLAGRVYAALSGFWNQYSHLQSFSPLMITSSGGFTYFTYQYQNLISGATSGVELATRTQIAPWWGLNINYSFLNADFTADGPTSNISSTGSVVTYEGSSPKHMVTVQSMLTLPGHIEFDPFYRFVSALPAQKVPAYQTMDVHFEKSLGPDFALEVVGRNLFQKVHYEWGTGDPTQPPVGIYRAGYVRLVFHPHAGLPQ